jgi:hypothetical protein
VPARGGGAQRCRQGTQAASFAVKEGEEIMIYRYIVVRLVSSYGNLRAIPVGPAAMIFARIAGAKTLTPQVLRELGQMGLTIAADGSTEDMRAMESMIRGERPLERAALIGYQRGMEDELDPVLEAHLDSKAEHGT